MEYKTNDSDALFEGLPDVGELTPGQESVPTSKPNVASQADAFGDADGDDLPF